MKMRRSTAFFGFIALLLSIASYCAVKSIGTMKKNTKVSFDNAKIMRNFGLTDLCIFTDASYTRHPAISGASAAFQDSPLSMEHFPSGSILNPYSHKANGHAALP